jgi:uncharacterized phage protein (TIGR01671 family)
MREIKFRVRRKDGRLIGYIRFESGRWQCQMLAAAGGSDEWSSGVLHGPTIEQYTGIKDKNAQEIYEGDRVSWQEPNTEGRELGEVKWVNDGFSIEYEVVPGQLKILYFAPDIEVIGNIYENPELLVPEAKQ